MIFLLAFTKYMNTYAIQKEADMKIDLNHRDAVKVLTGRVQDWAKYLLTPSKRTNMVLWRVVSQKAR